MHIPVPEQRSTTQEEEKHPLMQVWTRSPLAQQRPLPVVSDVGHGSDIHPDKALTRSDKLRLSGTARFCCPSLAVSASLCLPAEVHLADHPADKEYNMRIRSALGAGLGGAVLALSALAVTPAQAVPVTGAPASVGGTKQVNGVAMTCDAWSNSTGTIAYGNCTGTITARWRLGVICDSGYYYWSPWQNRALTKSYDCPGVPGKVTSTWIDIE